MHRQYFREIKRQNGGSLNRAGLERKARKLAQREARLVSESKPTQTQIDRFARDLGRYLDSVPDPLAGSMEKVYERAFHDKVKEKQ